jgi:hypothetical protein
MTKHSKEATKARFTAKEIAYHIKDESHAVKEYRKDGLPQFAKDENKHLKYWQDQKKKLK